MDISQLNSSALDHTPSLAPPPGVVPNFINPPTLKMQIRVASYVMLPIMFVLLVLRLYTRARVTRKFGPDDMLAIVSAICVSAYCGSLLWMLEGPLGIHTWDVPVSHLHAAFLKINLASLCLYALAALFVKVSLLVLYLRIFNPSNRARVMIWVGIMFIVPFYVACGIAQTVEYIPHKGTVDGWISPRPASMYTALLNITAVQGVIGVLTDFYILFIPMHFVVGLRLPLGRKIGVCSIFMTGLAGCICSILGTLYRFQARPSGDTLWETIPAYIVGIVELNVGIMCSCMPVVFVFFKSMAKNSHYQSVVRSVVILLSFKSLFRRSRASSAEKWQYQKHEHIAKTPDHALPAIPKPTMTGIRSFIRKVHRSQAQTQIPTQDEELRSYDAVTSMASSEASTNNYHTQLRNMK